MPDEINNPNLSSATGALADAVKQKAIDMAASEIARKASNGRGTMDKVRQGVQAAQQGASFINGVGNVSNTAPNFPAQHPSAAPRRPQAPVLTRGIAAQMSAEITIGGKVMGAHSHFFIHEQNDGHHHFSVTYDHDPRQDEAAPLAEAFKMIGETIMIDINPPGGMPGVTGRHSFTGIVTRAYKSFDRNPFGAIVVEGYSPTYLLDDKRTKTINSWYKGNVAAIVKELTQPLQPYRTNIVAAPKQITSVDYLCQYKETPFQFLRRIAHDYGEYFFYNGTALYYGKPQQEPAIPLFYGKDCENLQIGFELKAVNQSHVVYHSGTDKKEVKEAPASIAGLQGFAKEAYAVSKKTFTAQSIMPAPFRASSPDLLETAVKSHAASEASDMYRVSGTSIRHELKIGSVIEVHTSKMSRGQQIGDESMGRFIVTRLKHQMEPGDMYYNEFEAVPADVPMLPVSGDITAPAAEAQPAVVTDNKDPQGQGRVRVKFYWSMNDKGISDWIKVLTPDAGGSDKVSKNRGMVTIPEPGDLVMVDFRFGNPDEPFVTGSMHPGTKAQGGGEGNKIKSLTSRSGNTIRLDDATGSLHAADAKGNKMFMDGAGNIAVESSASIKLTCGKSTLELKSDGTITMNGKDITLQGTGTLSASSHDNATLESSGAGVFIAASQTVQIDGQASTQIAGGGSTSIKGGIVEINC